MKLRKRLKKVYGVGINDASYPVHEFEYTTDDKGNLKVSKRIWTCPYYEVWRSYKNLLAIKYADLFEKEGYPKKVTDALRKIYENKA